jgi:hypothetical protein
MGFVCVVRINSLKSLLSSKMSKLHFMFPIFFAILVSILFAQLTLLAGPYGKDSVFSLFRYSETFSPLNLLAMSITIVTILFIFFRVFKARKDIAVKILVATSIAGGSLSILLIGRLVLAWLGLESQFLLIAVAAAAFIGMFLAFLVLIDALSREARNKIFVISSGALGAFLGILIPTLPVIGISAVLSIADAILIMSDRVQRIVGEAEYEELIMEMAFSTKEWGIGIGDLIGYSMIAANTSANFGMLAGGVSLALILIGSFLTMELALKHRRAPGLPIATALGLLPSIIILIFS